jgi:hypothetical protein
METRRQSTGTKDIALGAVLAPGVLFAGMDRLWPDTAAPETQVSTNVDMADRKSTGKSDFFFVFLRSEAALKTVRR